MCPDTNNRWKLLSLHIDLADILDSKASRNLFYVAQPSSYDVERTPNYLDC
jgi:hypothetical protein